MVPFTDQQLRTRREANRKSAGITRWPQGSVLRHSFASYWSAHHDDNIDKLLFMLGHGSLDMLRKLYRRATSRAQAVKYFSILPPVPVEKVLDFSAAA